MKKFIYTVILLTLTGLLNAQWQPDVRLTNNSGNSYTPNRNNGWCIAADANVLHVVWYDFSDGSNAEIYYKRSSDGGTNWGSDTRLTNNTAKSENPAVAVSGSNVHVVWEEHRDGNNPEIYYKRSQDGGLTWGEDTRLTNDINFSTSPSIAAMGLYIFLVWNDARSGSYDIYYKRSTNNGTNWSNDTRLTTGTDGEYSPSIAVSGTQVNLVWSDSRNGSYNYEIYYQRSVDNGISWEPEIRLTNNNGYSQNPSIAVSGMEIHVAFEDDRDNTMKLYYKHSTNGGALWKADTLLTKALYPNLAVSGSRVNIVCYDNRDGNYEIYYKQSQNNGTSWSVDTRLTNFTGVSEKPSIAVSGSQLHVVWKEYRDGSASEIYYKRNPTGNVGIQNISTEIPSKYSLSQNYPNPFNPSTVIRFKVKGNSEVVLKVFDVQGREVQTLVNEKLQPGTYETSFNGSALNSGVYFYKLNTDGFIETKKMLLIK